MKLILALIMLSPNGLLSLRPVPTLITSDMAAARAFMAGCSQTHIVSNEDSLILKCEVMK